MKDTQPDRVRIGVFELDLRSGELRSGDEKTVLQEQPLQILRMLVEREGELVAREGIKRKLWPNDTVVEFDHSINAAIKNLRRALGDSAEEPRYIETLARRGYRLMVPVEQLSVVRGQLSEPSETAVVPAELQPAVLAGRTVSHYRVLDIIGGGGMGVVYRAEDLKLGRAVALKFLPEELGSDPQALERFSREARAVSSLDHPNICPIFEFGEHEGRPFMVMQLLEGQTLRDRLAAGEGALPLEELLDIALQVSDGLKAAHERGIIHRDIKPANVFLTNKGVCKILDFGLAKLTGAGDKEQTPPAVIPSAERSEAARPQGRSLGMTHENNGGGEAPLFHRPAPAADATLTRTGAAMGTAGYMSPEQVRGEKLDARTDLFSFGLVLYEMATGKRAFSGETAAVVHDAILHHPQIPVRDLNSKVPPELETIINKALEKNRERRYQFAAEMRHDLKELHGAEAAVHKPRRARVLLFWGVALAIVLLAIGLGLRWFKGQPSAPAKKLSERRLTHNPSENHLIGAGISADGKHLAYTDTKGLHLSVIETGEIHDVPLPEELRTHLWDVVSFPDGEKLLFIANSEAEGGYVPTVSREGNRLAVVKMHIRDDVYIGELKDGGTRLAAPTRLTVSESSDVFTGWMRDNKTLLFSSDRLGRRQIFRQQIGQDSAEPLIMGPDEQDHAELSPDGRWILYWSFAPGGDKPPTTKRLMRFPVSGGTPEQVLEARTDDAAVFRCPVRPATSCVFSHWEQGQLIFYALDPVPGRGKELARTKLGLPGYYDWRVSPEGSRIALSSGDQLPEQVRILDLRNGTEHNLPLPHGWSIYHLSWTADGNALFAAVHSAGFFIASIELDGKTHVLVDGGTNQYLDFPYPSPDGRHLAFTQRSWESNAWLLENF